MPTSKSQLVSASGCSAWTSQKHRRSSAHFGSRLTAPSTCIFEAMDKAMEICSWRPLLKSNGSHSKASEELFFKSFLLIVQENPTSFEAFVGQRRRECFPEAEELEVTPVNVFATSPSRKCHRYMVKL
eukprot:Skav225233  [mRNA]  locus=scaffold2946:176197:176580:+ [translate_table: standard]